MKTITLLFLLMALSMGLTAQISINTDGADPDASAILDVKSTDKGMLIPRMTTAQRTAIASPASGLLVFDTDTESFWFKETAGWTELKDGNIHELADADNNTKIQVEKNPNDDTIRFETGGTEFYRMANGRLEVDNTGKSIFFGKGAGADDGLNGTWNIGIGDSAITNNFNGVFNIAIGNKSLYGSNSSNYNIAIGHRSLFNNIGGDRNIAMGNKSMYKNTTGDYMCAIGYESMYNNTTGQYNAAVGYQSLYSNTTGDDNCALGWSSLYYNTIGSYNVGIGWRALYHNTTGNSNCALGFNALLNNTTGVHNNAFGYEALVASSTGTDNNAFGTQSLNQNTTGYSNNAFGGESLYKNTSGHSNNAFGYQSLFWNSIGNFNTANGQQALFHNISGNKNTGYGYYALYSNSSGNHNTAVGSNSLPSNTTGSYNTAVGNLALHYATSGTNNTGIGYNADVLYNATNATAIGANAYASKSNSLVLGNTNVDVGIGTDYPTAKLHVSGGTGSVSLLLEADTDNSNENDQPDLIFSQDGGTVKSRIGIMNGNNDLTLLNEYSAAINFYTNNSKKMYLDAGGALFLTTSPLAAKPGGGSWSAYSDKRLKQNIKSYNEGLEKVLAIHPVTFHYNEKSGFGTKEEYVGVIAQELQKVDPNMVSTFEKDGEEYLQVDNSAMTYMLINAVKELKAELDELKAKYQDD